MLDITKATEGSTLTMKLTGRVDTETASQLDEAVADIPDFVKELVIDMEDLEYVASSGLRVLLMTTKIMHDRGGRCVMHNVPELILEVFEMTGLTDVFVVD